MRINHPDHKPLENDKKKQILQVVKDQVSKSKMKAIKSSVPHFYHLNPSVDICTVKVGKGTRFGTFKDAGLKPIPVESLDPISDEGYPCKIIGYRRTDDGQSIKMHIVQGKGHIDGGNLHLCMNKVIQRGISGGPWIKDSNAIGLQSSVLKDRSSYSPLFTQKTLSSVGVDI